MEAYGNFEIAGREVCERTFYVARKLPFFFVTGRFITVRDRSA